MNVIEALKRGLDMEIRPVSRGKEYLEAVIGLKDLDSLHSLLRKYIGEAKKEAGREARFPPGIRELVDSLGGLRIEQSFFYKEDAKQVTYAAIWPWQSDPNRITVKAGVSKIASKA